MRSLRRRRLRLVMVLSLWLAAALEGCSSWRVQTAPPVEVLASQKPEKVRVTRKDSVRLELKAPGIQADTLTGQSGSPLGPARIALADISQLEVRKPDAVKSLALVGGIVGGLIAISLIVANAISNAID